KDSEFVCDCSNLDDVIIILKDGRYKITKISEKAFFDKGIYYIGIYKRNDERTIYNMLYRDGRGGAIMMKRCAIKSVTRDKEYDLTKGTAKSELLYLSVNPNGEAEILKIYLRPRARLKKCIIDLDLSTLAIKGRQSVGNLVTRHQINKIVLKERCASTLGGQNIWYDEDVRRLNTDGRGMLLGEFKGEDKIVVWTAKNQYYITGFDVQQHFPDDTIRVERYIAGRVYALCYYDGEQNYYYMKRFQLEEGDKIQFFLEEGAPMRFEGMTYRKGAQLEITFGGQHEQRPAEMVDVDEFITIKSHRAKGKRLSTYEIASLRFIEPEEPEMDEELEDDSLMDDDMGDAIDMEDIVGEEISADPNVNYNERAEVGDIMGASQLNLF
ncbi:MAG: DNA gyrase/topoisomerase IV subunit A, partial [Alistipes sp.]|nr:DNA gyrase/topoisomerase IV subunit A [Alistipes sp.]